MAPRETQLCLFVDADQVGTGYIVLDGHGNVVASCDTLQAAKEYCWAHPDRDDLFIPIASKDARMHEQNA